MDKVVNELIAENLALSKTNSALQQEVQKVKDMELAYNFQVISLGKTAIIRGVLLSEGIWKGTKFVYERMKEYAEKFIGSPIMLEHGHTMEFGKLEGGKVTQVATNDMLKCIAFTAEITDEKFIQLLKDKKVDSVSPKALWKVDDSKFPPVVMGAEPIELSLTASPACEFCTIFNLELSKYGEKPINDLGELSVMESQDEKTNSEIKISGGELSMSTTEEKKPTVPVAKPAETPVVPPIVPTADSTSVPVVAPAPEIKIDYDLIAQKLKEVMTPKEVPKPAETKPAEVPQATPVVPQLTKEDIATIVQTEVAKQLAPKPPVQVPDKVYKITASTAGALLAGQDPGTVKEVQKK